MVAGGLLEILLPGLSILPGPWTLSTLFEVLLIIYLCGGPPAAITGLTFSHCLQQRRNPRRTLISGKLASMLWALILIPAVYLLWDYSRTGHGPAAIEVMFMSLVAFPAAALLGFIGTGATCLLCLGAIFPVSPSTTYPDKNDRHCFSTTKSNGAESSDHK